jgi:hypothetical protein
LHTDTPPPGAVHELAERTVDFVRRALSIALDYTAETLPLLDHYLATVPRDQPETVRLIATTAGAYFGEVVRRTLGGSWDDRDDQAPIDWTLELSGGVSITPGGLAALAILQAETEGVDGEIDVPRGARDLVEQALASRGRVAEDEFYSLSGRLEILMFIVDLVVSAAAEEQEKGKKPEESEPDGEN